MGDMQHAPTISLVLDWSYSVGRLRRERLARALLWAGWSANGVTDPYVCAGWRLLEQELAGILGFMDFGHEGYERVWLRQEVLRLETLLAAEQDINQHPERWEVNRKLERRCLELEAEVSRLRVTLATQGGDRG